MFELAQQLSYYLSVVDGGATSKLVSFGQQLASIGIVAQTAKASIQSMIQPIEAVAQAWSGREQQINNITRSLRQYQYVGQSIADINRDIARSMPGATAAQRGAEFTQVYNRQFEQGRQAARGLIQDMNRMAAILPGEANDYMQTFSMSLPFLSQGRGMTDQRAARLSSYLTAGGIAGGIDAQQSGRDLMQFLTTGPHITDRSWTEVWSQYATRNNGQRVSAEQIRGMTTTQRIEILENIARQLQPMMDATGDSYEALKGTLNSFKDELYLFITEPLFDSWKNVLRQSGLQFEALRLTVGPVMRVFAAFAAKGIDAAAAKIPEAAARIADWFQKMPEHLDMLGRMFSQIHTLYVRSNVGGMAGAVGHSLGTHFRTGANYLSTHFAGQGPLALALFRFFAPDVLAMVLMRAVGVAMGPVGFLITSLLVRVFTSGGAGGIFAAIANVFQWIYPPALSLAMGLNRLYEAVMEVAAVLVETLLPPIIEVVGAVVTGLLQVAVFLFGILGNLAAIIMAAVIPVLTFFVIGLQTVWTVLRVAFRTFANIFGFVNTTSMDFVDGLRMMAATMRNWIQEVSNDLSYLLHELHLISDEEYNARVANNPTVNQVPLWMQDLRNQMRGITFDLQEGGSARTGHAPPNRPQVHQDFRYSRFDITQKFADGFSPERVAAAFVGDLESMASQRLSSGFAPAFSNG